MQRYLRDEETGDLYDRRLRRWITVRTERVIGNHYYINQPGPDGRVIDRDEVEERR